MSFYQAEMLPRIQSKVMNAKVTHEFGARVCEGLHGQVIEIGFGTGLNAGYYPKEVTKVFAIEPSEGRARVT